MKYDLIIFDNDGVLVDSERVANRILMNLLNEYGWPISFDQTVEAFLGRTVGSTRVITEAKLRRRLPNDFENRYYEELFRRFRDELKPIDGVVEALNQINAPICVASSGSYDRIRLSLGLTSLLELFEGRLFSADDVQRSKPAPDLFLLAAKTIGVSPERTAVVEDSVAGIQAANAAGMTSFGYTDLLPADRLGAATGGVFSDMRKLPELLSSK